MSTDAHQSPDDIAINPTMRFPALQTNAPLTSTETETW